MLSATEVCEIARISRGQLAQAFSRIGFGDLLGSPGNGHARLFSRGIAIMFVVAGRLHDLGVGWKEIRTVLVEDDATLFNSFLQERTRFDEWKDAAHQAGSRALFVIFSGSHAPDRSREVVGGVEKETLRGAFILHEELGEWLSDSRTKTAAALVIDVAHVLETVDLALTIKRAAGR